MPSELTDDQVLFLSDIMPTGWHGAECGGVGEGDAVAIWGAGPVGLLAAHACRVRGASKVALVDVEQYRLDYARSRLPGVEVVNPNDGSVVEALHALFPAGPGPDVGIEAVGVHYPGSWLHKVEMKLGLETDPSYVINEMIMSVRKAGRIALIGAYAGYCNHFNIGAFMEKSLAMRGGQTPCQSYWPTLLPLLQQGKLDTTLVITHEWPLDKAPEAYKMFNEKTDEVIKVVLKPGLATGSA